MRQEGLTDENIKMQESEVQAIKFVTVQELDELRKNNLLVEREEVYSVLIEYLFRL